MLRFLVTCQRQKCQGGGRAIAQTRRSPGSSVSPSTRCRLSYTTALQPRALFFLEFSSLTTALALNVMTYFLKRSERVASVILEMTNFPCGSFLVSLREPVSIPQGKWREGGTLLLGSRFWFHLSLLAVWRIHTLEVSALAPGCRVNGVGS